jgi:H+-transporting ATPase
VLATIAAVYGWFMVLIGWKWALLIWGYALAWFLVNDCVKTVHVLDFDPTETPLLANK